MVKLDNDKYYTPPDLAERLIETTFDVLEKENCKITDIIEPSAGSGSFSEQLVCTAYDISPEQKDVIQSDFLKETIPYLKGRLCIGNPPFGHGNTMSVKFYKKCCQIGDYVAFIQPISQLNNNMQMYEFDLIHSEDLRIQTYSDRKLHCCFNIYRRPLSDKLNPKPDYHLKDVTIIELRRGSPAKNVPSDFDYSLCIWGNGSLGKRPQYIGQYSTEAYIYVNNKKYLNEVINLLEYSKIRQYVKSISTKRIGKSRICKYLKDNIAGLS